MKIRLIISKIIGAILALSMFVAIGDQDYYYYILLRERVFFYGIILVILLFIDRSSFDDGEAVVFGVVLAVLLWNPISTISLDRGLWQLLNIIFGLFFGYITFVYGNAFLSDQ